MKPIVYEGEIWARKNKELHPDLLGHLKAKDCLIVIRHGKAPYEVVLGVPHQAAIGEKHICDNRRQRPSDENAASYALIAFDMLSRRDTSCKLVITAHSSTTDPNKDTNSPYCQEIFRDSPEHLIECHGAGESQELDLELSAGSNKLADPVGFGKILYSELPQAYRLGLQECCGTNKAIVLQEDGEQSNGQLEHPGIQTESLMEAEKRGIPALHLEAKPQFRIPKDPTKTATADGLELGCALAETIIKCWIEGDRTCQP